MRMFVNVDHGPGLEDHFGDVLMKAQVGSQQGKRSFAEELGCDTDTVRRWHDGDYLPPDEAALRQAAKLLNLDANALVALAAGENEVPAMVAPEIKALNFPFASDMTVNAWTIAGSGIAFDTGTDIAQWREHEAELAGPLTHLFLTHGHRDHIACLNALRAQYPDVKVYAHAAENIPGTEPVEDRHEFALGKLTLTARLTPGHSPGGLTYLIDGLSRPVAVCGDALFARSVGGIKRDYGGA
ncbi:MAG: MBL fold metallo-hydrolase, partial [Opitutales bacterium]